LQYKVNKKEGAVLVSKKTLFLAAFFEWVMVLPAVVFLSAAILRLLQPREYEPARTSWTIVEWTVKTFPGGVANVFLLGLPALVAGIGCVLLLLSWRGDETLRSDANAAVGALWRQRVIVILGAAVLAASAIVVFVIGHHVADLPQ
jgi:hypothetical protein